MGTQQTHQKNNLKLYNTMNSPSPTSIMNDIEKRANDPLQVLATQKKVSFDENNLRENMGKTKVGVENRTEAEVVSLEENTTDILNEKLGDDRRDEMPGLKGVVKPRDEDILSGRGAGVNLHPGNVFFRKLIQANKQKYIRGDPGEKKRIIKKIVEVAENHGRFLKQDLKTELWLPISTDDARKKTGQALRENAPAIKKQQSEMKKKMQYGHAAALQSLLPHRHEMEVMGGPTPPHSPQITNNFGPSPVLSHSSPTNILWSRMNMLQEKQEQLKRKQRELEDEQNQLMQYFYQMTASLTKPSPVHSTYFMNPSNDCSSDSDSDYMYSRGQKKRRIIVPGH